MNKKFLREYIRKIILEIGESNSEPHRIMVLQNKIIIFNIILETITTNINN